jgi:hypothetical protein
MKTTGNILILVGMLLLVGVASAGGPYMTFTPTPFITPLPTTDFGAPFQNMTQSNFSMLYVPLDVLMPYAWPMVGYSLIIPFFLIFMFVFLAMWRSGQNIRIPTIIGILFGTMIFVSNAGLGLNMPPELAAIGYGCLIASIAGLILSVFKKI